jgi:hypothetical protein
MASGGKYLEIPSLVAQLPATVSAALAREGGASLNEDVTVATRMVAALERDDPDRIIDLAIELRGEHKSGRPVAAAQLLEHVKERFKHQPAGARAHYLYYTTVMRRLGFGRRIEPSAILGQFIERYPKDHPLMDDVILELGRFHDVYSRKWELAEALYRQVIRDHAGTNAVDNALYFIAEHHLANGNYVRAVEYYARVVAQVGARRLARLAAPRERETRKAVRGVEQLKTLKGIGLDLRPTAWGGGIQVTLIDARSSIRRDDVLQELAGKKIDRPVDFFAVASELPVGSVVKARFEGHREVLEPGQDEHRQFVIDVTIARARAVDVVEVAENDTLTLRPRPDHRANPPSATAAANAECLEVLDSATASTGHPWHRIRAGKGFFSRANGWANARYLVPSASCVP